MPGFGYNLKKWDQQPASGQLTILEDRYQVITPVSGTGASQNVAHTLGTPPSLVFVQQITALSGSPIAIAEGTHTSTNVVLTMTSGATFKVVAFK